jgi:hypothetical protein
MRLISAGASAWCLTAPQPIAPPCRYATKNWPAGGRNSWGSAVAPTVGSKSRSEHQGALGRPPSSQRSLSHLAHFCLLRGWIPSLDRTDPSTEARSVASATRPNTLEPLGARPVEDRNSTIAAGQPLGFPDPGRFGGRSGPVRVRAWARSRRRRAARPAAVARPIVRDVRSLGAFGPHHYSARSTSAASTSGKSPLISGPI